MDPMHLPTPKQLRDLLTELLGREVAVSPGTPLAPSADAPATFSVFVDNSLTICALIVVDLDLSAHAGAAIGLMPPPTAREAIEEKSLPDTMKENLYEVLNIASAMFNIEGARHTKLHEVYHTGDPVPPLILGKAFTLGQREDLNVSVTGYGPGRVSLVLV